ncbi:hypothetical protein LQZ18_05535 [Lachnospiraceae bacterium ZAX-1]
MSPFVIVLIVITAVLLIAVIVLYLLGKKSQKKKDEQDAQIAANAQTMSMLIIDKKRMRLSDAGLPATVVAQTPKIFRRSKVPIVKAKVGPKVVTMICDAAVFDIIPVKKEVKAVVSGLYITGVKGLRGGIAPAPKKKRLLDRLRAKAKNLAQDQGKKQGKEEKGKDKKGK